MRVEHQVDARGRAPRLQLPEQAAEPLEHLVRGHPVERVRPEPAPQLAHDRRRVEAAPDHVADRHPEAPVGQREGVVPVTAEPRRGGGQVAAGQRQRRQARQPRDEAALERVGQAALALRQAAEDRERRAVGGALEQFLVVVVERALGERPDVQDSHDGALDHERHAQQRFQPLLTQDRVVDVGLGDVQDPDRAARGGDAAGEAAPDGDPDPSLHLLLESLRGARDQRGVVVLEQQDRGGVDPEDPDDAVEQLLEQVLERQVGERGIRDALEVTEPIGGDAGLHAADSALPYGISRSRTASLKPTSAARRWNS